MKKEFNRTVIKVIVILTVVFIVASGVFVMGQRLGITLPGFGDPGSEMMQYAQVEGNVQTVSIEVELKEYTPIVVQKGIPVYFIIKADPSNLNSCNNILTIPEYGIEKVLEPGKNIIEFTPQKTGIIPYSCKMGMIKSKIRVVDDVALFHPAEN